MYVHHCMFTNLLDEFKQIKIPIPSNVNDWIWRRVSTDLLIHCVSFNRDLDTLKKIDASFVNYLSKHWLPIINKWARHAQPGLVHFGNRTNNRLENANGRLKEQTNRRNSLAVAIQTVWNHSGNLIEEHTMCVSYNSDRCLLVDVDSHVRRVLDRLTTYAAKQVVQQLSECSQKLRIDLIRPNGVSWFI